MKTNKSRKANRVSGSVQRNVSRVELMNWALGNMSTPHLRRLKAEGETAVQIVQRLRTENNGHKFEIERLQEQMKSLWGGHRAWREEAVMLHKRIEAVMPALAALGISEEMRTKATREIAAWLKAPNDQAQRRRE